MRNMTQEDLIELIGEWRNGRQELEDFIDLMSGIRRVYQQGLGLGGTEISNALRIAFGEDRWYRYIDHVTGTVHMPGS